MNAVNEQDIPSYLVQPKEADHYYGTLRYHPQKDQWVIEGEPAVCQMAKRLFPGADGRGQGIAKFKSNKRTNGDLNWLMMRYPLQVLSTDKWQSDYQVAVDHVLKRKKIMMSAQTVSPSNLVFKGQLTKFQQEGVAFLVNNSPSLCADDMGLGKTVEGLAWIAMNAKFPGLIVVPTSVQYQWRDEIKAFIEPQPTNTEQLELFPDEANMVHIIKGLKPYELPPASFYIIHYGLLRGWKNYLPSFGFEFVVFDEIQELRRSESDKYSATSLLSQSVGDNVIGLSGTPIYNKGSEMCNVMSIIDYQCLGDNESFRREWCTGFNSELVKDPKLLGEHLRREGLMIRRTKEEVNAQLPPKRRIVQRIDSDEGAFTKGMKEVVRLIGDHDETSDHLEKGRLKRQIGEKVRQATGVAKAPYVAKFVEMLLEAGEAVVLYGYHHEVYEYWREALKKYKPVFRTGLETHAQKEESKRKFVSGESNLIIISLRAAAGIDGLQDRDAISVFGELDWSPGIHAQCEDRTNRMSKRDMEQNAADSDDTESLEQEIISSIYYYLVCSDGSDEQMMEALGIKTAQFVGIMGGEGESQEDRAFSQTEVGKHLDKVMERYRSKKGRESNELQLA